MLNQLISALLYSLLIWAFIMGSAIPTGFMIIKNDACRESNIYFQIFQNMMASLVILNVIVVVLIWLSVPSAVLLVLEKMFVIIALLYVPVIAKLSIEMGRNFPQQRDCRSFGYRDMPMKNLWLHAKKIADRSSEIQVVAIATVPVVYLQLVVARAVSKTLAP